MIVFNRVTLALLVAFVLHLGRANAQEVQWRNATSLEVEGKGWTNTAGPFDRLPDSAKDKINSTAWQQSKDSAGLCIRFVTDAAELSVRWSLTNDSLAMPHMPATGVSGVDLYTRYADGKWWFIGNGRPGKTTGNLATFHFTDGAKPLRECLLYLPLYNGTKSLEIGVPAGAHLNNAPPRPEGQRKPIVIYGTSITQGGCASRPGMAWTSILGRLLDRPVINLGFSASGSMEAPVAEPLAELDPAAYMIDCTWNMGTGPEVYLERITKLVHTIRKARPLTPIIFVGQSLIRPDSFPDDLSGRQAAAVTSLQKEGVQGLILVPADNLIGHDGEGAVDGVHLNDLGMDRQARCLLPIVNKALNEPANPRV
jgi:lysophospholipase L1-like esterase